VASSGKKKTGNLMVSSNSNNKVWVDTVTDLNQYKASAEELEARKLARKSNNKLLAKVALADKRQAQLDPDKQRLIQQKLLGENRSQPNQNVEAILARSEQVMEICQGILNGEMITPSYTQLTNTDKKKEEKSVEAEQEKEAMPVTPYMNSAALNEIAGELLITVRELREELLQEREARDRLEREVVQQRELLSELAKEVVRLQIFCTGSPSEELSQGLETTKIV